MTRGERIIDCKTRALKEILNIMNLTQTKEDWDILRNAWKSLNEIDHIIMKRGVTHGQSGK